MNNSDPLRQLIMGAVLACVAVIAYFTMLIAPLQTRARTLRAETSGANERARAAGQELRKVRAAQTALKAGESLNGTADHLAQTIPETMFVSCPPEITKILRARGLNDGRVQLHMVQPFRAVESTAMAQWEITLPSAPPQRVGEVLADLENRYPFGRTESVMMTAEMGSGAPKTVISFETVVKQ